MELLLLVEAVILLLFASLTTVTSSASSLAHCNCATFNLDQYNQERLHGNLSQAPFTNRSDLVCCNAHQLNSLASLDAKELAQLTSNTEEVRLRGVASPMLLLGHVPILYLSGYSTIQDDHQQASSSSSSSEAENSFHCRRMRHFSLSNSHVNVDLLDQIALHCHHLTVFHLERIWPVLVPDPAPDNPENGDNSQLQSPPMHRQFNVLTRHFASRQLAVLSLINCQIISLAGFDLLANATALRMVSLSRNHLTSLESGMTFFPTGSGAHNLWSLDLSYNKLRSIPMDWPFPGSLRVLRLDHNQFKVLQFDPFKAIWFGLSEFWIGSNIFDCNMMAQSEEWMQVLMAVVRVREQGTRKKEEEDDFPWDHSYRVPIGLDSWICYHHNGTRRLPVLELPLMVLNNRTAHILGGGH